MSIDFPYNTYWFSLYLVIKFLLKIEMALHYGIFLSRKKAADKFPAAFPYINYMIKRKGCLL